MTSIETPWMIEGGAKHTVQVARNLAYMASGGMEGITNGADLEVRELAVPGTDVRVFPGTCSVLNRAAGAKDEAYIARVDVEKTVAIAATGAAGRSDMIVLRIENPYAAGETWPDPAVPADGPYASLAVISGVPANANRVEDLGMSADHTMLPLARVDIPANTGTITQAMIVDLRKMSGAVSKRDFLVIAPTVAETLSTSAYSNWPNNAVITTDVPEWATHVRTRVFIGGVKHTVGDVVGGLRVLVGDSGVATQGTSFNTDTDNIDRVLLMAGSPKTPIPKADRGRQGINFRVQGKVTGGTATLTSDKWSMVTIEVEFINEPESNL